jgi:hypothetical protein
MDLIAMLQEHSARTAMDRLAQPIAYDPDTAVRLALVDTIIDQPIFAAVF